MKTITQSEIIAMLRKGVPHKEIFQARMQIPELRMIIWEQKEYWSKTQRKRWKVLVEYGCCNAQKWSETAEVVRRVRNCRVTPKTCPICRRKPETRRRERLEYLEEKRRRSLKSWRECAFHGVEDCWPARAENNIRRWRIPPPLPRIDYEDLHRSAHYPDGHQRERDPHVLRSTRV